jgi:hypothetical protein
LGSRAARLEVSFATAEQLAESLLSLVRILESDGHRFAHEFEPEQSEPKPEDAGEMEEMFARLLLASPFPSPTGDGTEREDCASARITNCGS